MADRRARSQPERTRQEGPPSSSTSYGTTSTDDWQAYKPLRREYLDHRVINHSAGQYVQCDVYTNTIEGVFGNLKTGMRGCYKHDSPRYLQSYLDEFAWRHNAQRHGKALFGQLLARATS